MRFPGVAVDTREQRPYEFPLSETVTLRTGDYAIIGLEHLVAVERKTASDAYSSLGSNRRRFRAEVERLGRLDYGAIVIEASLPAFLRRPMFSRMSPESAIGTLLAWSVKYGVAVFFAGDRKHGRDVTLKLLEFYWRYRGDGKPAEDELLLDSKPECREGRSE